MATNCCNIVYNSELILNEFHTNNFAFVLDKIPVSFLMSKFNSRCLNLLGPSDKDYAKFNNRDAYIEANNDVRNLALFLKSIDIPGCSVDVASIGLHSTADVKFAKGKLKFDQLSMQIQVDENFFIPRFFYYWLVAAANPEEIMKYDIDSYNHLFYTDGHLLLLDNNRDKTVEIKFERMHPQSISSIKLENGDPQKAFITVNWMYTSFVMADEYNIVYKNV